MNPWLSGSGASPPLPKAKPASKYNGIVEKPKRLESRAAAANPKITTPSSINSQEMSLGMCEVLRCPAGVGLRTVAVGLRCVIIWRRRLGVQNLHPRDAVSIHGFDNESPALMSQRLPRHRNVSELMQQKSCKSFKPCVAR